MEDRAVRPPAVAGSFYPADRAELASEVARLLAAASPGPAPKALIVISSDLSHDLPWAAARRADAATAEKILALQPVGPDDACGAAPVNGFLAAAARRKLRAKLIDLRNSGDTAGDRSRVVGYGAFAFHEPGPRG